MSARFEMPHRPNGLASVPLLHTGCRPGQQRIMNFQLNFAL